MIELRDRGFYWASRDGGPSFLVEYYATNRDKNGAVLGPCFWDKLMPVELDAVTVLAPLQKPEQMPTPGQLLSARERAAVAFRERLTRDAWAVGRNRAADHVTGFKFGWDAALAFLRQQEPG